MSAIAEGVPSAAEIQSQNAAITDSQIPQDIVPVQTATTATQAATEATQSTDSQSSVAPEIAELAKSVGLAPEQFNGYKDLASAEEAVRTWLDNKEKRGTEYLISSDQNRVVGGSAPQQQQEETEDEPVYAPLDLKQLGLTEDQPIAKAFRLLEQQAVESRQTLNAVIEHINKNTKSAETARREQVFAEAQGTVASWKSPLFGIPGPGQTVLQQAAVEKLYQLARKYELDDIAAGNTPAPLVVRLGQARFKLGDKGKSGPVAPTTILPDTKGSSAPPTPGGSSYTGAWSRDPSVQARLRAIR